LNRVYTNINIIFSLNELEEVKDKVITWIKLKKLVFYKQNDFITLSIRDNRSLYKESINHIENTINKNSNAIYYDAKNS